MANGKLVNIVNSVHRRSYMAGDRLRRSRRARGGLGFALARERIAQLIKKWISMIFLGLIIYPKIMKIVLPLSYHEMNMYKNFGLNWNKLIYFIIHN